MPMLETKWSTTLERKITPRQLEIRACKIKNWSRLSEEITTDQEQADKALKLGTMPTKVLKQIPRSSHRFNNNREGLIVTHAKISCIIRINLICKQLQHHFMGKRSKVWIEKGTLGVEHLKTVWEETTRIVVLTRA